MAAGYSTVRLYRIDSSGSPVSGWTSSGVTLATNAGHNNEQVEIVTDGASGAIVTWLDTNATNPQLMAQRIDPTGSLQWTASGVSVSASGNGVVRIVGALVSDGSGGAWAAWSQGALGNRSVYAQHLDGLGALAWGASGVTVKSAAITDTGVFGYVDACYSVASASVSQPADADSRTALELNIRYLIDDLDKSNYAISSVRMVQMMNGAMQSIAGRTVIPFEDVYDIDLVAGTYDYSLSGIEGAIHNVWLAITGMDLERMTFDDMVAEFKQDTSNAYPQGRPRYYSLHETSGQLLKIRVAPTPNTLASFDTLKVRHSLIPNALTVEASAVPFSDTLLRAFERQVAAECVLAMSPDDRKKRMIGMEQVRDWLEMVEMGIREENFRQRVASGATQDRIMEVTDQWR